jgi:exopolyphosphatase/guanosine-5'-triphosphate,3'-diphosphate pyrophosphatase
MGIKPLTCVATAAVREAEDGPAFQAEVEKRNRPEAAWVIDGAEEARLSAQGVLLGWPEAKGLVCDIGGNSMELAGSAAARSASASPRRWGRSACSRSRAAKKRCATISQASWKRPPKRWAAGMSGSIWSAARWRAIARLDMERRDYPLTVLHEYRMTPEAVLQTRGLDRRPTWPLLRGRTGTSAERMELVPLACEVLRELVLKASEIDVSAYGIREGLLVRTDARTPARCATR